MKGKILSALKTKYPNLGLSDKAFDGVASFLEKTITSENDIDTTIGGDNVSNMLKAFQGEADKLRGEKSALQKELEKLKATTTPPTNPDLDGLKAELENLKNSIKESERKKLVDSILSGARAKMKENGSENEFVLDVVLGKAVVGDNETAESLAARLKGEYDSTYKRAYGSGVVPPGSSQQQKETEYKEGDFKDFAEMLRAKGELPKQ